MTSRGVLRANSRGVLRIRLIDEPMQTRFYVFDPKSDDGFMCFIPLLNGTNSQTVPGFLVHGANVGYCEAYFRGILGMWNRAATLEAWKIAHPNLQ